MLSSFFLNWLLTFTSIQIILYKRLHLHHLEEANKIHLFGTFYRHFTIKDQKINNKKTWRHKYQLTKKLEWISKMPILSSRSLGMIFILIFYTGGRVLFIRKQKLFEPWGDCNCPDLKVPQPSLSPFQPHLKGCKISLPVVFPQVFRRVNLVIN